MYDDGMRTTVTQCDGKHVGRCTEAEGLVTFTREEAENALKVMGFQFHVATAEWKDLNGNRGRLCHYPSFCDPNAPVGTRWWLRRPAEDANDPRNEDMREIPVIAEMRLCLTCSGDRDFDDPAECPDCAGTRLA